MLPRRRLQLGQRVLHDLVGQVRQSDRGNCGEVPQGAGVGDPRAYGPRRAVQAIPAREIRAELLVGGCAVGRRVAPSGHLRVEPA